MVAAAKWLENLGCDFVIHHIGYDERRGIAAKGMRMPSPLDQLRESSKAVNIPVQAVGGLTIGTSDQMPRLTVPRWLYWALLLPLTVEFQNSRWGS